MKKGPPGGPQAAGIVAFQKGAVKHKKKENFAASWAVGMKLALRILLPKVGGDDLSEKGGSGPENALGCPGRCLSFCVDFSKICKNPSKNAVF